MPCMRTVGVSQSTAPIPVLWGTRRVNTPKSSVDHLTPQFKQINIVRSLGAHVATPLQDLCIELHTHTQYKTFRATQLHTHFSLQHIVETSLTIKYILGKKNTINANSLFNYYLHSRLQLIHSSTHRVTRNSSWKTSKVY